MKKIIILPVIIALTNYLVGQPLLPPSDKIIVPVINEQQSGIPNVTVELLRMKDSLLVKAGITDSLGMAEFQQIPGGAYFLRVSSVAYATAYTPVFNIPLNEARGMPAIILTIKPASLQGVIIVSKKPFIQQLPGKTIINLEAGITNAGTSVLEVLEKLPGVSIDKNGNVILKGRPGVMIMIDNKPAYVSGSDLVNMLSNMSSSQIDIIELMGNPSSQYDAAGNAGIINLKTRKTTQKGFNGSINTTYRQGRHYKNNNSLVLNYRNPKWNIFLNYSLNANKGYSDIYALRQYYKADGKTIETILDQPSWFTSEGSNHTLRSGADYFINKKTSIGIALSGVHTSRHGTGNNTAIWKDAGGSTDSVIFTHNNNKNKWRNKAANLNIRHAFNADKELTIDVDILDYHINTRQAFQNNLVSPGGYEEAFKGELPSLINIITVKSDYATALSKEIKLESGFKTSHITTDNNAAYFYRDGIEWKEDPGKTNHFLYSENIRAIYSSVKRKSARLTMEGGLRYEYTHYNARQAGNSIQRDSAFSRNYGGLFPSASLQFEADSIHQFSLTAGRRIDRPAFQKLNPFLFIINKYTYQQGNSLIRPQYTWNTELSHSYKNILITSIGYSITQDYFSQLFLSRSDGTVIYTEGNFSRMRNFSASLSANISPAPWWVFSAQATINQKKIQGLLWTEYEAAITQFNFNMNSQFNFIKNWTAELTGFYITKSQNDIQEILEPTGQVGAGVSRQVLKNKGTIRLSFRDIFYTQAMEGLTLFKQSDEYFIIKRDSRVATIGFTYRFGKSFKAMPKRSNQASEEMKRVGNSN